MEEKKDINLISKINFIKLQEYNLETDLLVDINKATVSFEHNLSLKTEEENILIESTTIIFKDLEKTIKIGQFKVNGSYHIEGLQDIIKQFEGKMPKTIFELFINVQISTLRGFIILKTENTPLENAIFGIVNPATFFATK